MATKNKKTYSGRSGRTQSGYTGGTYAPHGAILLGSQKVRTGAKSSKEYIIPRKVTSSMSVGMSTSKWDSSGNPTEFRINIKKGKKKKK